MNYEITDYGYSVYIPSRKWLQCNSITSLKINKSIGNNNMGQEDK